MSVAWMFIPIANFFMPALVVADVAKQSDVANPRRAPVVVYVWWASIVIWLLVPCHYAFTQVGTSFASHLTASVAQNIPMLAATIALGLVVREISNRQHELRRIQESHFSSSALGNS